MGDVLDMTAERMWRISQESPSPDERLVMITLLEMYLAGEISVTYDAGEMRFELDEPLNEGLAVQYRPPSTDP
jgi:hypothetical protein